MPNQETLSISIGYGKFHYQADLLFDQIGNSKLDTLNQGVSYPYLIVIVNVICINYQLN